MDVLLYYKESSRFIDIFEVASKRTIKLERNHQWYLSRLDLIIRITWRSSYQLPLILKYYFVKSGRLNHPNKIFKIWMNANCVYGYNSTSYNRRMSLKENVNNNVVNLLPRLQYYGLRILRDRNWSLASLVLLTSWWNRYSRNGR